MLATGVVLQMPGTRGLQPPTRSLFILHSFLPSPLHTFNLCGSWVNICSALWRLSHPQVPAIAALPMRPAQEKKVDEGRKADQKAVDAAILKAVAAVPNMKQYLGSYFTLSKGQFPHQMVF